MEQHWTTKQHDRETEAWKKIVDMLRHENIIQKNKLATMLKNHAGNNDPIVEKAEQYQGRFLQQDEAIRLMFNDINEYEKLSEGIGSWDKVELKKINQARNKLKKETRDLEINFSKLRSEFNHFLE